MGKLIVFLSLIMPVFMYGMDKIYVKPTGNRKQKETKAIQRSNLFIKKTRQHYQQAPQAPMPQAQILVGEGDEQRLIVGISSCSFDVVRPSFTLLSGTSTPKTEPHVAKIRKKQKINPGIYYDSFKKEIEKVPEQRYNPYNRLYDEYEECRHTINPHNLNGGIQRKISKIEYQKAFDKESLGYIPKRENALIECSNEPSFFIGDNITIKFPKKLKSNPPLHIN